MAEHHVSVTVNAPVHQVYTLFTHFNDFPKFMSFVKEVTYYDDQRSHWVAQILLSETENESPWQRSVRGTHREHEHDEETH
ncbi:MAG: hypothetical protein E6J11_21325 [Chloroflexi bacterium]|nr:MAG: hypothetical protein E6J11_21325 [Chloroflexota bacterium]